MMREFFVNNGPHIRDKNSTSKIMRNLLIALLPIIIFACYKNGFRPYINGYGNLYDALKPIIMILLASFMSLGCEIIADMIILKKKKEDLKDCLKHSYAIFPGLFLALTLPINTPIWVLLLGVIVASLIGKMIFGGFGNNVFNPALVGNLFIITFFYNVIATNGGYLNKMELDAASSATPLSNLKQLSYNASYDKIINSFGDIWHFMVGLIPGSLAETSKILCLLALIYLIVTKVIKWRIPVFYIITVFIMTAVIGYFNGMVLWYPLFHILSGGLLFGAIFMATDPVTSPTTNYGQVLFAIFLGILTVLFRFLSNYSEGVLISILIMNMMVFILDKIGAKIRFDYKKSIIPTVITIILLIVTTTYLTLKIDNKVSDNKVIKDTTFKINSKVKNNNITVYNVSQKGFHGLITAEISIDSSGEITSINIISQQESAWSLINDNNYLSKIVDNQTDLSKLDTISSATYTSNYLKQLVTKTLNDYNGIKNNTSNTDINNTNNNITDTNSSATIKNSTNNNNIDTSSSATKKNIVQQQKEDLEDEYEDEKEDD
jgi:Na+-translocating ferredoxin:NAD+ oxidoreductase subunit D